MENVFRERLKEIMEKEGVDAVMVAPSQELRFLAGFNVYLDERFQAMFLTAAGECFYICNLLSRDEVEQQAETGLKIYTWTDNEDFAEFTKAVLGQYRLLNGVIGANSSLSAGYVLQLAQKTGIQFVDSKQWLEEIRIIKSQEEMEKLRTAARITDDIFEKIIAFIRPGLRETDIRTRMEELFSGQGVKLAGDIVASGPNSAIPHYFGNQREIQRQDIVILDYGCIYKGMFSDMTRTVFVSSVTSEQERVYQIMEEASRAGKEKAIAGAYIPDVDRAARDVIKKAGYGDYFTTRPGHGIGYITHEQPEIKASNRRYLETGMAFSIEPGIYMAGKFGVRIEDTVLLSGHEAECLNGTTHEIIVI